MAVAVTDLMVRINPETTFRSDIVDPMPVYPDHAGKLAVDLASGNLSIQFTWGYMLPGEIHAAIARLRDALDQLDIDVDDAIGRQELAAIKAAEVNLRHGPHCVDDPSACIAAIDAESPAEGHEVIAEWTRPEGATA